MATPAAILSLLVQTEGARAAAAQIRSVDTAGKSAGGSLKTLEGNAKRSSKTFSLLGTAAKSAGVLIGGVGLAKAVNTAVSEFREAQKVGSQTSAVLKSTGSAANVTKKHIENLAGAISKKSGIDDEAIQSSANMLLTFTKVRNETGKGNKIFDRATQTVTDMSVALGQSGKSSAIQLGKALNDPVKGVTALQRVGVSFTKDQKKQIETMVKSGRTLDAQKLILRELGKEFGGSAAAQATAGDKLKVSVGNLAEAAGGILVPQLDKAATFMAKVVDDFVRGEGIAKIIIPAWTAVRDTFKEVVDALTPFVQTVGPALLDFFRNLPQPIQVAAAALGAMGLIFAVSGPLGLGIAVFAAAAVLIKRNWSTVGPILQSVQATAVTVFDALKTAVEAVKTAFASTVEWVRTAMNNVVTEIHKWDVLKAFLMPAIIAIAVFFKVQVAAWSIIFKTAWGVVRAVFKGAWTALRGIVEGGIQEISGVIKIVGGIFKGDFGQIWDGIKDVFRGALKALGGIVKGEVETLSGAAVAIGKGIAEGVLKGLGTLGHVILDKFKEAAKFVVDNLGDVFSGVGDVVTGVVKKLNPFGDGLGIPKGAGGGSANLMGANKALGPFASIGAKYGLSVSSGRRPGAVTSSGNVSYHSSGDAIDEAGSPAGMLAYFKYLRSRFGGRLAELIYTPGGVGIKDGKPFRYTGAVAADHFDHVHVAFKGGGSGDGIGRLRVAGGRSGDGIGQIESLWTRAGGSSSVQNLAAAIAMAESGGNPTITNRNSDGSIDRGLWQINSVHGSLSTVDRMGNARAAVKISGNGRNWNPWTVYRTGAYKKFLGSAQNADGGSGGKGKPKTGSVTVKPTKGVDILPSYAQAALDPESDEAKAIAFAKRRAGGAAPQRPVKGRTAEEVALIPQVDPAEAGPTIEDYANQRVAEASLTAGTEDDLSALNNLFQVKQGQLASAYATGDPRAIVDAITSLKSVEDSIKNLQSSTEDQTQALKDLRASIDAQTAFAKSVTATSSYQATKTISDLISGHIVGYGVAGRKFTPGSGTSYAY